MQLYMSEGRVSKSARRWAWANRPIESLDNPVKRYLRNRRNWRGPKEADRSLRSRWRWIARPAF